MTKCIISGCTNDAKPIARRGKKTYYSCPVHVRDVAQIVAAEHGEAQQEKVRLRLLELKKEKKSTTPNWIKL